MVLDLEDPGMRLMRLGTRALFDEPILGLDEGLRRVSKVTVDEVCRLAQDLLDAPAVEAVVGPGLR
jgi:predicted Zn-dependent peptidase